MDYVSLLVAVGLVALPFALPNTLVEKAGYGLGKLLSGVFRQKIGKQNELKVEHYVKGTVSHFVSGLTAGMESDDNENGNGGTP